jgi:hypothetical protein
MRRRGLTTALTAVIVAACGLLPGSGFAPDQPAAARPCLDVYSADRCEAMLTAAAETLGVADDDVTSIVIAPDPTPRPDGVIMTLGGARPITVLARVGADVRAVQMCGGVSTAPACSETQALVIGSAIGAGYRDVPCAGEGPTGCASPLPSLSPDAVQGARPLRIDQRVIDVPTLGRYEVLLGKAVLPNGILTTARGDLADTWPDRVRVSSSGIQLEIRSLIAGRPAFTNYYEHGWWPGTEEVEVFLAFEARHVEPGATIEIRDLVVG